MCMVVCSGGVGGGAERSRDGRRAVPGRLRGHAAAPARAPLPARAAAHTAVKAALVSILMFYIYLYLHRVFIFILRANSV